MEYKNTNRKLVINSEIIEWDMKSANISVIQEFQLLPQDKIDQILKMNKKDRVRAVGLEMKADHEFGKTLEKKFTELAQWFIKENDLDQDYDVLSIKKDAIYVVNKEIKHPTYGTYVNFIKKNVYHAYIYLKPFEFYMKEDNSFDVKGLRDVVFPLHKNGIFAFLEDVISIAESNNMSNKKITKYLVEFINAYKNRELDYDIYREFNNESKFRYQLYGEEMLMTEIDDSIIEQINISYNYMTIILPLIQILC